MEASTWFMAFHMIQLALVGLVAVSVFLLADQFGRASAWPVCIGMGTFLIFFSAYDTLAGIGTGLAMRDARGLPAAEQDAVFELVESWPAAEPWVFWLSVVGTGGWVLALGYLAVAARAAGAARTHWVPLGTRGVLPAARTSRAVRDARLRQPVRRRPESHRVASPARPGPDASGPPGGGHDRPSPSEHAMRFRNEHRKRSATGEPGGEWFCSASRPSTCCPASCIPQANP